MLCVACALWLAAMPRPLPPDELPALQLSQDAIDEVLRNDARDEKHAPRTARALELERLFLEHGEAEDSASEDSATFVQRKHALATAYAALVQQAGEPAALALRARELAKLEAALGGRLPEEQLKGVMGAFANLLDHFSVTRNGEEQAPHFVVRTFYKGRWNVSMGLAPDFGFAKIEKLAYHGWLALHADKAPDDRRLQALDVYASVAGAEQAARIAEARGVLLFRARQFVAAGNALQDAYEKTGNIRLRNYVLAAQLASGVDSAGAPEKPAP